MKAKPAIVCVDDEAIILMALENELRNHFRENFIYAKALNADSALEIIKQLEDEGTKVVLVISDWLMPGIKGDVFLEIAKKEYPDIRAILITGQADEEAINRVKKRDYILAVLRKPWSFHELREIIKSSVFSGNV